MPLSAKARRAAHELEVAIAAGRTREVVDLVASYGLSAGDRIAVVRELDRKPSPDDVELRFGQFDQAFVRDLPKVWAQGLQSR